MNADLRNLAQIQDFGIYFNHVNLNVPFPLVLGSPYTTRMFPRWIVLTLGLWCFAAPSVPVSAALADYVYDQEASSVTFMTHHLGFIPSTGHFETFSGSFRFDPEAFEDTRVNIRIFTASVKSDSDLRDKHLRSKKFFASEKHPEIRFVSRETTDVSGAEFKIHGNLTIRGITHPVIFHTTLQTKPEEVSGNRHISFHTHAFISRKDFQLGTEDKLNPILWVTSEILRIDLEVVGLPARS